MNQATRSTNPNSLIEPTSILFEGSNFLSALQNGVIETRCNVQYTDIRDAEPLEGFVIRHGGAKACAEYLKRCYRDATKI